MKVCASINAGPFNNFHERFDSVSEALEYFRSRLVDNPYLETEFEDDCDYSNYGVMDLYPQCDQCYTGATFHDYPMARYGIGRRHGLRKVAI